jgi:hypothetical protein
MLFRPDAFEPLTDEPWRAERVSGSVRAVVRDVDDAFAGDDLWPAHEWDAWTLPQPLTGLYAGAAGVVWALDVLRKRGHAETQLDLASVARTVRERWRAEPGLPRGVELPAAAEAGLLLGETGVLLTAWRVAGGADVADDLLRRLRESRASEADEVMWGIPGALLTARAMHDWTGELRWAEAWLELADALWERRTDEGLWTQHVYGETYDGLAPPHGLTGNTLALLGDGDLLGEERRRELGEHAAAILEQTAVRDDGCANWPGAVGEKLEGTDGEIRLQWCSGAPGIVASAARYLGEELLLAGGALAWAAGPHGPEKGPSICHGTAASGYAFLKLHERTGDELWLDRARRFAVHALGQVERARRAHRRGRYSLWTGDLGVAIFAADCLDGRTGYPVVEALD